MLNPVVNCGDVALPITLDLPITVTKDQITGAVDLSVPVFVTQESPLAGPLPIGPGRILYYDSFNSVIADWGTLGEVNKAATAFFSQNPRTQTLAVAQAFTNPQAGYMLTGAIGSEASFIAVSDGEFSISIDGVAQDISALDFTADITHVDIMATIAAGLVSAGFIGSSMQLIPAGTGFQFKIVSGTVGNLSTVSVTSTVTSPSGTDISGILNDFINGRNGITQQGYTPTGLEGEMLLISEAAKCAGRGVYGWVLDNIYRETAEQLNAAAFTQTQMFGLLFTDSASPQQKITGETVSNMYSAFNLAYESTYFEAIDDVNQYNAMAMAAIMLSVDYSAQNSIRDGKFNFYSGLATTQVSETQLAAISSKRGNTYVVIGNGARETRNGTTSSPLWYLDSKIGVDNFVSDLLTDTHNVFLSSLTVPYTPAGQEQLRLAIRRACLKYVNNGLIADRIILDPTDQTGTVTKTLPAFTISFVDLALVSQADRDARIMPGTVITLQLAGSIHVLRLSVNVKS